MRIMHIEAGRRLYGGARQVGYLIEGLDAAGVDNLLVCARGSGIAAAVRGGACGVGVRDGGGRGGGQRGGGECGGGECGGVPGDEGRGVAARRVAARGVAARGGGECGGGECGGGRGGGVPGGMARGVAERGGGVPGGGQRGDGQRGDGECGGGRGGVPGGVAREVEVVELPMGGDLDMFLAGRLRRLIDLRRPSVVHVHSRRGVDLLGGWCARRAGVPAVLTRRVDDREPAWWARIKYNPYRAVVAISSAVEAQLLDRAGLDPDRVVRVASAVDTERYRPDPAARQRLIAAFGLPAGTCIVGVIAQLIARKGHGLLMDCLPEVLARHPDVRLLCFGRGPLERRLRRRIAAAGLVGRVRLAGFRDDLAELLPGLDMLVHPALREGLGVAVLEAMSAGVPVVAADAGGLPDAIEHERSGLLVKAGNRLALRDGILRMLDDEELRRRLARAGRERVRMRFSVDRMIRRYLEVYNRVLEVPR